MIEDIVIWPALLVLSVFMSLLGLLACENYRFAWLSYTLFSVAVLSGVAAAFFCYNPNLF